MASARRVVPALFGVAMLWVAACFSVNYVDGLILCGEAGCPPGYLCASDGTCRRSAHDLDAGADARGGDGAPGADAAHDGGPTDGGPGDAAPVAPCNGISLLADDFDDGEVSPLWGNSYGGTIARREVNGYATFTTTPSTWAAYVSTFDYDLTGGRLWVEVDEVAPGPGVYSYFGLKHEPGFRSARIIHRDGEIYAEHRAGSGAEIVGERVTYDPIQHRYWQIREAAGTIYYETSPNGTSWTALASEPVFLDHTAVLVELGLGTDLLQPQLGRTRYDNLNGGTPSGEVCRFDALSESFGSAASVDAWAYRDGWDKATCSITGGQAVFTMNGGGYGECWIGSRHAYDLVGQGLTIEVPAVATGSSWAAWTYFGVQAPDGTIAHLVTDGHSLVVGTQSGNSKNESATPYQAANHRWWRLRESGGRLYAETSADGQNWSSRDIGALPFATAPLTVYVGAGADTASALVSRFDNLNLAP